MSDYAIIRTGGKQYRVAAGQQLRIDLLHKEKGDKVTFDDVLLVNAGGSTSIGTPNVAGAKVTATVVEADEKGKKLIAFKMKRRKGFHKKHGHRQRHTSVKIDSIG